MNTLDSSPVLASPHLSDEQRKLARRCLWGLGILGAGSLGGVAFSLYLVNHYPLLLMALSPLGRHLVLVAPTVDPTALVFVTVIRRMAFYLLTFYLGRALGSTAIDWLEARSPYFARFVRWLERLFARASHLVVLVMAGPTVSALAGISGMRVAVYLPLATTGLVARILLVIGLAEWLREPIEWMLALIDRYWVPGTVVLVVATLAYQRRKLSAESPEQDPHAG